MTEQRLRCRVQAIIDRPGYGAGRQPLRCQIAVAIQPPWRKSNHCPHAIDGTWVRRSPMPHACILHQHTPSRRHDLEFTRDGLVRVDMIFGATGVARVLVPAAHRRSRCQSSRRGASRVPCAGLDSRARQHPGSAVGVVDVDKIPDSYEAHAHVRKRLRDRPRTIAQIVRRIRVPAPATVILGAPRNRLPKLDLIDSRVGVKHVLHHGQQALVRDVLRELWEVRDLVHLAVESFMRRLV